jgi:hypothetical protein
MPEIGQIDLSDHRIGRQGKLQYRQPAARLQYPMGLPHHPDRILHVANPKRNSHHIKRIVGNIQMMRIAHQKLNPTQWVSFFLFSLGQRNHSPRGIHANRLA